MSGALPVPATADLHDLALYNKRNSSSLGPKPKTAQADKPIIRTNLAPLHRPSCFSLNRNSTLSQSVIAENQRRQSGRGTHTRVYSDTIQIANDEFQNKSGRLTSFGVGHKRGKSGQNDGFLKVTLEEAGENSVRVDDS